MYNHLNFVFRLQLTCKDAGSAFVSGELSEIRNCISGVNDFSDAICYSKLLNSRVLCLKLSFAFDCNCKVLLDFSLPYCLTELQRFTPAIAPLCRTNNMTEQLIAIFNFSNHFQIML